MSSSRKRSSNDAKLQYDGTNKRKKCLPLAGKLVAVSTLAEASPLQSPESYSQLIALCRQAGADTTSQVHKRVDFVIASDAAVAGETQRVRKGWKLGIPVLNSEWIKQCLTQESKTPLDGFLHEPSIDRPKPHKSCDSFCFDPRSNTLEPKSDTTQQVDLGCCCICHENTKEKTNCEWCIECGVNEARKRTS